GEAVVLRNIGGRVTPGLLEQLGLLGRIGEVAGRIPGGGRAFHLIVLDYTDCGFTRLAGDPRSSCTIFKYRKANSERKRSPISVRRSPSTLLRSGRFPHCRVAYIRPRVRRDDWICRTRRTVRADSYRVKLPTKRSPDSVCLLA
ncbi:MAG: hypothetical protein WB630_18935, partial [Candidatus Acidiferrales bacterium]